MKLFILVGLFFAFSALGVDGYQDLKFGISYQQLSAKKKCSLIKDMSNSTSAMHVYSCTNFRMTSEKTISAVFYFIDGKLLRIGLVVGDSAEDFAAYAGALSNKYGQPSRRPASLEISLFDQGKSESVDVGWDNDTVLLRQFRDGLDQFTMVIYSSPSYDAALLKSKTKGLENAL
jgi:hypothetical protein